MANELRFQSARESIADYGRAMLDQDLTRGTGGNLSVRVETGEIAISPSGVPYDEITPEAVAVVDADDEQIAGEQPPSSELPMHQEIYAARPDIDSIFHTHSPYASTFAILDRPIPASLYLVPRLGEEIPVVEYEDPGSTALGELAAAALTDGQYACLLKHHGAVAIGDSVEDAFDAAVVLEQCAQVTYQADAIGDPVDLPAAEVTALQEMFHSYRTGYSRD